MQNRKNDASEAMSVIRNSAADAFAESEAIDAPAEMIFEHLGMLTCLHQIKAADIALKRSQRPDVQQFAQQMQGDYQDIAERLMAFLGGLNEPHAPAQNIDPVHRILIDDLEGVADNIFDARYIAQQEAAINAALALFEQYGQNGKEHALRNLVRLCIPVLEQHLQMIGELNDEELRTSRSQGSYAPL